MAFVFPAPDGERVEDGWASFFCDHGGRETRHHSEKILAGLVSGCAVAVIHGTLS
jgi:hypothetical protein